MLCGSVEERKQMAKTEVLHRAQRIQELRDAS